MVSVLVSVLVSVGIGIGIGVSMSFAIGIGGGISVVGVGGGMGIVGMGGGSVLMLGIRSVLPESIPPFFLCGASAPCCFPAARWWQDPSLTSFSPLPASIGRLSNRPAPGL